MSGTILSVLLEVRSVCQSVFLITQPQPVVAIQDQNRLISTVFIGKNMAAKQPNTHEQLSIRILSHKNCNNSSLEVHFQCKKLFKRAILDPGPDDRATWTHTRRFKRIRSSLGDEWRTRLRFLRSAGRRRRCSHTQSVMETEAMRHESDQAGKNGGTGIFIKLDQDQTQRVCISV